MTSDYREEFFVAATLAQRAGEAIREIYYGTIVKEIKGDGTPVTNADKAANEIIVNGLMERFPADGMVSEEIIGDEGNGSAGMIGQGKELILLLTKNVSGTLIPWMAHAALLNAPTSLPFILG